MAFTRPTLTQIIDRVKGDFKSGLSLPRIIRRSFLDVFSKAISGLSHILHGHILFGILKKFFPDTGDEATVIRWGTLFNLPRKEAVKAEIVIDVTGTSGGTLPANQVYTSGSAEYEVKDEVIVPAATTVNATIVARDDFEGDAANLDPGDIVNLQSAIPGINSEAVVVSTAVEGEDLEPLETYRIRVLERMGFPPSGGNVPDYISFAKKIAGVTRAWVLPGNVGEGTVGVTFVEDGNAPASIIPSAAKVEEVRVQILIDEPQGTGGSNVFAPNELEMNPSIQIKPNTAAVQAAVTAELEDLLAREAQVRDGVDPEKVGLGVVFDGKIKISQINEAISIAQDEEDHILLSPVADVQPQKGGLVTLGTPVFSTLL